MSAEFFKRAEELFFQLRGLGPTERDAALDKACGNDKLLRAEVVSLLGASVDATRFLDTPALGSSIAAAVHPSPLLEEDLSGKTMGVWRLVGKLAAGGMGAVYLAERADGQFQQRVAVKVVKRGLDTDEILRRFKSERQTLAALNHPNIARLLDGGVADNGRPFLVMELVEGVPIDEYCDAHQLDVQARIKLMRTVCEAVRSAHQALVVHRDLKPSNILVDETGLPKLLDFGIAKVLAAKDGTAAATLTTDQEKRLTPEYASPEQVRGEPIGTASDVYSLGVILYEILAGERPYKFNGFARAEIERVVCFTTPPPPSTTALRAGGEHVRRSRALRGDLDTIILMAMRKEPQRRYASVDALIADLDRYLQGRPVQARPDTLGYRVSKFVRRNPMAVGLALIAVLSLVGGIAGTTWQARRATKERDEAFRARDESEAAFNFIHEALSAADPTGTEGPETKVISFINAAARDAPAKFKERPAALAMMLDSMGRALGRLTVLDQAEDLTVRAYEIRKKLFAPGHHDLAESLLSLGELRFFQRRLDESTAYLQEALRIYQALGEVVDADTAEVWNDLGVVQRALRCPTEAIHAHLEGLHLREKVYQKDPTVDHLLKIAESLNNIAAAYGDAGDNALADATLNRSFDLRRQLLPPDHPLVVQSISNLAVFIGRNRDFARAAIVLQDAIDLGPIAYGKDNPAHAVNLNTLGSLCLRLNRLAEGEQALREAVRIRELRLGPQHAQTLNSKINLGRTLLRQDEADSGSNPAKALEGERILTAALEHMKTPTGGIDPLQTETVQDLVNYYLRSGQVEQAAHFAALVPSLSK